MGLRLLVGRNLGRLDSISTQAYSLYSQGMTYREISQALGIKKDQVKYRVVKYARLTGSPYPLPKRKYNGDYLYALYKNGMNVKDISSLMSLHKDKVYLRVKKYCESQGIPNPFVDRRPAFAYKLRTERRLSYLISAKIAGFSDRSSCYRAVKRYEAKLKSK
jgi:transposase-like protein